MKDRVLASFGDVVYHYEVGKERAYPSSYSASLPTALEECQRLPGPLLSDCAPFASRRLVSLSLCALDLRVTDSFLRRYVAATPRPGAKISTAKVRCAIR